MEANLKCKFDNAIFRCTNFYWVIVAITANQIDKSKIWWEIHGQGTIDLHIFRMEVFSISYRVLTKMDASLTFPSGRARISVVLLVVIVDLTAKRVDQCKIWWKIHGQESSDLQFCSLEFAISYRYLTKYYKLQIYGTDSFDTIYIDTLYFFSKKISQVWFVNIYYAIITV